MAVMVGTGDGQRGKENERSNLRPLLVSLSQAFRRRRSTNHSSQPVLAWV